MQINDIIFQIDQWARVTLNDKSPTYINEKIMHLQEEINEVALDPQDPLELADVFILISAIADFYNIDLEKAILDKMVINKTRTFKLNSKGLMKHVM